MWRETRVFVVALGLAGLTGCALPYYWQAVGGQLDLMRRRVPIEAAVGDEQLDAMTRERLQAVVELREFATAELRLPDNDSYSTFVDLGRDYVVWNVIAAEPLSVDPIQWCFPVAGCVSYRGYFDQTKAAKYERRLAAKGYDTWSGGSGAYSTLGYFSDPVLSTMIGGNDVDLARTLFHELAHQRLYIKGDSELSEAFASAVEEYGVERLLAGRGEVAATQAYREQRARGAEFSRLIERQRDRLREIYALDRPERELLELKSRAFAQLKHEYEALRQAWGGRGDFDPWIEGDMNNARLAAISTYRKWLPGLRWRLERVGVETFYAEVEVLGELSADARAARLEAWNVSSAVAASAYRREVFSIPAEITSGDRGDSFRLDAKMRETVAGADARDTQRAEVVEREGLAGNEIVGDPGLHLAEPQRQTDDFPSEPGLALDELEQLAERIDIRTAQLERLTIAVAVRQ